MNLRSGWLLLERLGLQVNHRYPNRLGNLSPLFFWQQLILVGRIPGAKPL